MQEYENQKNMIINQIDFIKEDENCRVMSNLLSFIEAHSIK